MRHLLPVLVLVLLMSACTTTDLRPASATSPAATAATAAATGPVGTGPATAPSPSAMSWSRIADIPTPRSEVAAAVFRDAIYVVAGFGGPAVVERYVPAQSRWERMPDLPIGVDHPMAAAIETGLNAGLYVIGGYSGGRATARAFHLLPGEPRWRELAAMPGPRAAGAAVAVQSLLGAESPKIYIVGGASGGRLENVTLEYDAGAGRWRTRAPIPTPRDHLAAAALDGRVCSVGGRELSMTRNLSALECYDPAADTWERLPAAPTARGGVGAAVVGTTLIFIGGEQPQGTFKDVELYDARARRWSTGPGLPTPRHGMGVVAIGNAVYVMSGGPTPGGSQTAVCEVLTLR